MMDKELETKFLSLASLVIGETNARKRKEMIDSLEDMEDIAALTALLGPSRRTTKLEAQRSVVPAQVGSS